MKPPFLFAVPALAIALAAASGSATGAPNFAEDIAPIVFQNCTNWHRPGQAGPFPHQPATGCIIADFQS